MKKWEAKTRIGRAFFWLLPFLLIFCILGGVVFSVSRKITGEMSESAIQNLSESLGMIKHTVEAILDNEADFQVMIAKEVASARDPEAYVRSYEKNEMIVKVSLVKPGEERGVSNVGEFSADALDFSGGRTVQGLPVSQSYLNYMGAWAYTLQCPVEREGQQLGTLYIEYTYEYLERSLPDSFYDHQAVLYVMGADTERFVLMPKGMGKRDAGHVNLQDYYQANDLQDAALQAEISECLKNGTDILFAHKVRNEEALNYMWAVNGGSLYLVGYVPVSAIQREGKSVNQNLLLVIAVMLTAFVLCCVLYFLGRRQQNNLKKEQELEREVYNRHLLEALQAAQIANNSKTTFLSNMSHDIRTPMNAVIGFTSLLDREADDPEKVREYAKKITASGQHLLGLINNVLDISKIESGKSVLNIDVFNLENVLASTDAIIQPMVRDRKQQLHVEVSGIQHTYLEGDETRIKQVLINLLSNAVKYTPEGGNIWFRMLGMKQRSSQYERLHIEVEDDGYGMTQEYLKVIFDAFTRAENSTTNKVQGTGLGMAITKSIVEQMGGTIEVSSEVNKGSLFQIELELRISDKHAAELSAQERGGESVPEAASLEGMHFLAAEDNEINAEILSELLNMEGASCEIVENGQEAVERFKGAKPGEFDAILMDVQMPLMNGYEATQAIRALPKEDAGSIVIIAMTANAFAEDEKAALDSGMNSHVPKPIDLQLLKQTICRFKKEQHQK